MASLWRRKLNQWQRLNGSKPWQPGWRNISKEITAVGESENNEKHGGVIKA